MSAEKWLFQAIAKPASMASNQINSARMAFCLIIRESALG